MKYVMLFVVCAFSVAPAVAAPRLRIEAPPGSEIKIEMRRWRIFPIFPRLRKVDK